MSAHNLSLIHPNIRVGKTGRKFVTFLDPSKPKDEQALNVFFTTPCGETLSDTIAASNPKTLQILWVTPNEGEFAGQLIPLLCRIGEGSYVEADMFV